MPAGDGFDMYSGATLTVPLGGIITVSSPDSPEPRPPCLPLPGATDIVVSAGQTVSVDPWAILSARDTSLQAGTGDGQGSYALTAAGLALADPAPGDALSTGNGSSFLL